MLFMTDRNLSESNFKIFISVNILHASHNNLWSFYGIYDKGV